MYCIYLEITWGVKFISNTKFLQEAFNELLTHIETSKQWNDIYTMRLKEVLLDVSATPFKAEELNDMLKQKN